MGSGGDSGLVGSARAHALAAVVLAALFVAVVALVGRGDPPWLDRQVAEAVLGWRSAPLDRFFWLVTLAGNAGVLGVMAGAVVVILLLWRAWSRAVLVGAGMLVAQGLSSLLKAGIDRDRPPVDSMLIAPPESAGLPSGHAMMTIVFFALALSVSAAPRGTLDDARTAWKRALPVVMAVVAVGLIGFSRVYLGVHWITDVLAGWSIGGAWAALCLAVHILWNAARGHLLRAPVPLGRPNLRRAVVAFLILVVVAAYVLTAMADPLS